jgi:predicted metal-dependent peptidase
MATRGRADAGEEVGRSILSMLLKEPFYAHLLGGVPRRIGEDVPTAAVALTPRGPELLVNPGFFLGELNPQERVAVIKHEALHLVFRHLYRPLMRNGNAELFNIAADLVVNQHVAPWPLPESAVTLALFPDLKLEPNRHLEWYYEKLEALHRETQKQGSPQQTSAPQSAEALERIMGPQRHSDHRYWAATGGKGFGEGTEEAKGTAPLSETLRQALEADMERHLVRARDRTSSDAWGRVPAGIRSELATVQERRQGKVDWKRTLRLFASSGFRTKVVPTNKRMSKRFGTFPGIRIRREQRVAVVVDTSGSIDPVALQAFFREIHAVWRTGAEVVVVECDAAVQQAYPYRGKTPTSARGGGGTAFDPAFAWLREPRNGHFDVCVYLTDGYGPEPAIRPRCPLLWLVTDPRGVGEHLKWGRTLVLEVAD